MAKRGIDAFVFSLVVLLQLQSVLAATVFIDPAVKTVNVGDNVIVRINISNVVDLYGLQFNFRYNASVLQYVDARQGNFMRQGGVSTYYFPPGNVAPGLLVSFAITRSVVTFGASGSGDIGELEFKAIAPGTSNIGIEKGLGGLFNTTEINNNYQEIPYNSLNGSIIAVVPDAIAPSITGLTESPSDLSIYTAGRIYEFNATIIDANGIGSVKIEFNGVNYSVSNAGNNVYRFAINNLAAGSYSYYWRANDTNGNVNNTGILTYTVSRSSLIENNNLVLKLNNFENNVSVVFPADVNASAYSNIGTVILYRDSVDVSASNGRFQDLAAGYYNFTAFIPQTQNYTALSLTRFANVTKAVPSCSITSNSPVIYPASVSVSGSCVSPGVTAGLYLNNVSVSNPFSRVLNAGIHGFIVNVSSTQNYSSASANANVIVNQNSSYVLNIAFSPGNNVVYGISTTATGIGCPAGLVCSLARNAISVENPDIGVLAAGSYLYNYSSVGNQNYSSKSFANTLIVNKASSTTLVNVTPSSPIVYGALSNFSCSNNRGMSTILYVNSVDKSSEKGLNVLRNAGLYDVNCTSLDSQNYTGSSQKTNYQINEASAKVSLTFDKTSPQTYGISIIPTCSVIIGTGTPQLRMNDSLISSGVSILPGAGTWRFNCSLAAGGGYAYAENVSNFVINKANSFSGMLILGTSPITYGTMSNFQGSETLNGDGGCVYSMNRANAIYGAGTWMFNYSTLGCANYSAGSVARDLIIDRAAGSVYTFLNNSRSDINVLFGTSLLLNGSIINGTGIVTLYMNGVSIASGTNIVSVSQNINSLIRVNITSSYAGNQNYTSASETWFVNIDFLNADVNRDGFVTVLDMIPVGYNLGLSLTNCNAGNDWCNRTDVSHDGKVNVVDIMTIGFMLT